MDCRNQVDMDVSGRILRAWMPAIHAGMPEAAEGQKPPSSIGGGLEGCTSFSCSVGECKLMTHFVVRYFFAGPLFWGEK